MRKKVLVVAGLAALLFAGVAGAAVLSKTIFLSPGKCKTVHGTRVCAKKVKPHTVTHTRTSTVTNTVTTPPVTNTVTNTQTVTVTVGPSPMGQTFSGNGSETLAPMTVPADGVEVHWTAQPNSYGFNDFMVTSQPSDSHYVEFDNGNSATSGESYIPAGTYTFDVSASAAWTLSF